MAMAKKRRQKVKLLSGNKAVLAEKLFGQTIPPGMMVRENPRTIVHRHTYGGLSKFFLFLAKGMLSGTTCVKGLCRQTGIWLPPRVHCPDCWNEMQWVYVDTNDVRIYTYSVTSLPGAGFMASTPCPLISVEIPGVCTKFMSYLSEFGEDEPYIGMPVRPVFRTKKPTHSILDISFAPKD